MENLTLNNLYKRFNKNILVLEGYSEIKNLIFLIKASRLKPFDVMISKYKYKVKKRLFKKWIDEFGNSLNFKNKEAEIIKNDLSIDQNILISTDPYQGLSLKNISNISKFIYLLVGKDEDFEQDHAVVCFLGIDNYFRAYYIYNENLEICSPLSLGFSRLMSVVNSKDLQYTKELNDDNFVIFPCNYQRSWIGPWPNDFLMKALEKENSALYFLLK